MNSWQCIFNFILLVVISSRNFAWSLELELQLVNIVSRHGDRAPETSLGEMYPNDPNFNLSFFPMGPGGLTNEGKRRAFRLGEILRENYDKFLSSTYLPEDIEARSTDFDRTKMTLQLILAGLYPPDEHQKWHPTLNWQPIPITHGMREKDLLLMPTGCPNFKKEQKKVLQLPEVKKRSEEFANLCEKLTQWTGKKIDSCKSNLRLYNTLIEERAMNLAIPKWAEEILTNGELAKAAALQIELKNYNTILKRLNGGVLLRKMQDDMIAKMNGSLTKGKKMNLYSAHDINVAAHLLALGITEPHQPYFTSSVIIELYRDERNNYYVQVLYYLGDSSEIKTMQVPGCSSPMCPFDEYINSLKNVTASDDELQCS